MVEQTTVAPPWWARAAVWSLLPVAGAGLGWLLNRALDWAARIPWPVMRGPIRLAAGIPEPGATIGALTVGAAAGLTLAFFVDRESLAVRLSLTEVELRRPGTRRVIPRAAVATAHPDGDRLVLLDRGGRELAREPSNLPPGRFAPLFRAGGVAWSDDDPYADSYRRWVPGLTDLPAAAQAVFAARQQALDRRDEGDADDLRAELGRLGYVVRDEKRHQRWRRAQDPA